MKKYYAIFIVSLTVLGLTSCNKGPVKEIDAAQQALDQAVVAEANIYLEKEYLVLQDSMTAAKTEVEAQKSKMFGNFSSPKRKLAVVTTQAADLVVKTEVRKNEIKDEISALQNSIQTIMDENNRLVETAPTGKEGRAAIESIKIDLAAINSSLSEITVLVGAGDLLNAETKINAVYQKATEINSELKMVMARYLQG